MRTPSLRARLVALAILVLAPFALAASCNVATDPGTAASGGASAAEARQELSELSVAAPLSMSGYSRDRFPHWISQGNGCDTRDVVLQRQGSGVVTGNDCKITTGNWHSPYDGKDYTDPLKLDIDHLVPLAAAWRAGASKWTDDQRSAFANDLTRPQLFAVTSGANRSKGDQEPTTWKPPLHSYLVHVRHQLGRRQTLLQVDDHRRGEVGAHRHAEHMPIDEGAVAARKTDIMAGPGGVMTDEVGVVTGELTLCTVLLAPAHGPGAVGTGAASDGAAGTGTGAASDGTAGNDLEVRVEYRGAAEWYVVTGGRTHLCGERDLDNVHRLAVGLLDRPEG